MSVVALLMCGIYFRKNANLNLELQSVRDLCERLNPDSFCDESGSPDQTSFDLGRWLYENIQVRSGKIGDFL